MNILSDLREHDGHAGVLADRNVVLARARSQFAIISPKIPRLSGDCSLC